MRCLELLAHFDDILTTLGVKLSKGNKTLTEATFYEANCYGHFLDSQRIVCENIAHLTEGGGGRGQKLFL